MALLANISILLFIAGGIICGISLFGRIYSKISEKSSKLLSNISFTLVCISGTFSWILLILI